jgi:hypothetical protein
MESSTTVYEQPLQARYTIVKESLYLVAFKASFREDLMTKKPGNLTLGLR